MITRNATAILAAIFLVTISSQVKAVGYCSDSQCGYSNPTTAAKTVKIARHSKAHAVKRKSRVQVASISNEPMGEAPAAYGLAAKAAQYMGQTAHQVGVRSSLWCSAFIRKLTNASGVDDRAISWLHKPRVAKGCINCIAVMSHHVGIVKGYDKNNNPILISGNHRHRVGVGAYPSGRILAYVTL